MKYCYELNKSDLRKMKLKPTHVNKYGVEQNGWTGIFYEVYEVVETENGLFMGNTIIKGSDLTENQIDYILKCECKEY